MTMTMVIDNLPLDYTILEEIDYKYEMSNAYYGSLTKGCIRKCSFCAVPKLEPVYEEFIPIKDRIERVRETCGEQRDLLLMDNNVMASKRFDDIIEDIIDSGFGAWCNIYRTQHVGNCHQKFEERNQRPWIYKKGQDTST